MASRQLTMAELNKTALDHFVYQPVSRDMIAYLAHAAQNVISCDPTSHSRSDLPPTPPKSPEPEAAAEEKSLPTVEEFITQLVVSSNVQVPTLMSSLVYLNRLKSRLQPQARGIRCTAHRIFLASLILAAKYLNDSSPKNKHWANYTNITTDCYHFGFSRTEVNTMEKQLLFLLEWDLRIEEHDLYREFDYFLEPLRQKVADRHARKMQQREEKKRQQEMYAAQRRYPSPVSSRGQSRTRTPSPEHCRSASNGSTPPGLSYSSSASSYASSISSAGQHSRSATPLSLEHDAYTCSLPQGNLYDSPVHVIVDTTDGAKPPQYRRIPSDARMLPYEISTESYHQVQDDGAATKKRQRRGVWERLWSVAAR
ncbi:Cyclin [Geosmithia morbida]|uniref:Cyclin n=1 Tax=Geosmithia morbida TaxID=1094350 RepID=A0A9P5D6J2_9HYPO|nr:Cyclin [Geosmithia morbida]KAF4125656.1 Cyclin [Geosmithia morbida]